MVRGCRQQGRRAAISVASGCQQLQVALTAKCNELTGAQLHTFCAPPDPNGLSRTDGASHGHALVLPAPGQGGTGTRRSLLVPHPHAARSWLDLPQPGCSSTLRASAASTTREPSRSAPSPSRPCSALAARPWWCSLACVPRCCLLPRCWLPFQATRTARGGARSRAALRRTAMTLPSLIGACGAPTRLC